MQFIWNEHVVKRYVLKACELSSLNVANCPPRCFERMDCRCCSRCQSMCVSPVPLELLENVQEISLGPMLFGLYI